MLSTWSDDGVVAVQSCGHAGVSLALNTVLARHTTSWGGSCVDIVGHDSCLDRACRVVPLGHSMLTERRLWDSNPRGETPSAQQADALPLGQRIHAVKSKACSHCARVTWMAHGGIAT